MSDQEEREGGKEKGTEGGRDGVREGEREECMRGRGEESKCGYN